MNSALFKPHDTSPHRAVGRESRHQLNFFTSPCPPPPPSFSLSSRSSVPLPPLFPISTPERCRGRGHVVSIGHGPSCSGGGAVAQDPSPPNQSRRAGRDATHLPRGGAACHPVCGCCRSGGHKGHPGPPAGGWCWGRHGAANAAPQRHLLRCHILGDIQRRGGCHGDKAAATAGSRARARVGWPARQRRGPCHDVGRGLQHPAGWPQVTQGTPSKAAGTARGAHQALVRGLQPQAPCGQPGGEQGAHLRLH